ncbi:MAG: AIR synthase [Nitrososphaerota archaeon]|nr:AIR synthase [Nitrososphaerota archaeon]
MATPGKESERFMERAVYAHLGAVRDAGVVRPGVGLDNGVVKLASGNVLIVTVDPVSAVPELGMELSAWLSAHLIASDFTTSGRDPEHATFSYNFPQSMTEREREAFVASMGKACGDLGVAIVAGHTGSYPGGGFTVIGAGSMMAEAPADGFVTPAMAGEGDSIVVTKQAAIEAAGSLAMSFPNHVEEASGLPAKRRGRDLLAGCTTVPDARSARKVGLGPGGVTSMHDATEGGVLGALDEMAAASAKAFQVEVDRIPVTTDVRAICHAFGLDPLETMGEGALLITCGPDRVEELLRTLRRDGVSASEIGKVKRGKGLRLRSRSRVRGYVRRPDPYWLAYAKATASGLE